jgi:hypothetical protein
MDDGRTEFEIQQRDTDGGWSDSLFASNPRLRSDPVVGRWYSSRSVQIEVRQSPLTETVEFTDAEYADLVCDGGEGDGGPSEKVVALFGGDPGELSRLLDDNESATNAEVGRVFEALAEGYLAVAPPPEYREYHLAIMTIASGLYLQSTIGEPDEEFGAGSLFAALLLFGGRMAEAERNLTPQAKQTLELYGCEFDEEDA